MAQEEVSLEEKISRIIQAVTQMKERSGPCYETAKERSRIVSEAWRASGSPRHVRMHMTPNGTKYVMKTKTNLEEVSKAEWDAWRNWQREKIRLYREMGWNK